MNYLYLLAIYIVFHFLHESTHFIAYKMIGCHPKFVNVKQMGIPIPVIDCPDAEFHQLTNLQKLFGFGSPLLTTAIFAALIYAINPFLGINTFVMVFAGSLLPWAQKVHNPISGLDETGETDGLHIIKLSYAIATNK